MGRGYWTYHRTFEAGCCGPCCVIGLLMIPAIPFIGGYHAIRDAASENRQPHTAAEAEAKEDAGSASIHDNPAPANQQRYRPC